MRLHLTVQRHGLPVSRILWTTSPPSLFGHDLRSPSSALPATSSAVTSSRMPNALYANGGYTVAQLLEDVNEVIPLETEPQLFDDQSSGQWGLEDYVVEVGGSECLHFMEVEGLLRDGDEVLIRALQIDDLRARRISGRHQISNDGKHLIDGIPFGKPFLKRPTSSRPAITIPPRKKRRTTLAMWGGRSNYEEEDTEWAPRQHIGAGKELSLLRPESELEREDEDEDEDEYVDAYQDDYEDFHEPNEDGDGTVIRHHIDKTSEASYSDNAAPGSEAGDIGEELEGLKEDMDSSAVPELETPDVKAPRRGYSLRSTPSILQPAPRKSSLSRRSTGETSRRESKSVTFDQQKQELPMAKPEVTHRAGSTSEELEGAASSDSDSSVSDSSVSESSDEDSSSRESEPGSSAASESSSDSDDDSSESSTSESESEQEEVPKATTVRKASLPTNPPGAGSERTRKSNQRAKLRRRLTKLKQLGFLEEDADFDALREWDSGNGGSSTGNGAAKTLRQREQEDFEAKRQKLLRDLESGGIDVSYVSEKENMRPSSVAPDTSELTEDQDEQYETANDTAQATPEVTKQRRSLDVASTRRLLFGSLGVRTPRSKAEEEATRKKLAGQFRESTLQKTEQPPVEAQEIEPEVDWREKLILGATECVFDDIELSTPPFPFQQRWDEDAGYIIQQRKGRNKKRKRRQQQLQVYDEEADVNGDYYGDDDMQLNYYDDAEQPGEMDETTIRTAENTEDDLPELPSDASSLPDLAEKDLKPGLVLAFKQLDVSKETNWQPMVSDYRIAVISDVFDNNILNIQLAKAYRRQPKDEDDEEGPFKYSGFEMPGMDDEGEDDGFREVPFDDLIEPKLLRAVPAADAGDQDTASIFPVDDEQPAREASQSAIDVSTASDAHENGQLPQISSQQPSSPNHDSSPVSDHSHEESPVRSPRFEGFEPTYSASGSSSSSAHSETSSSDSSDEEQGGASPKRGDDVQSSPHSTCPSNADDHEFQETGLTEQLQTISSPGSVGSYHKLMDFLLSQHPSSSASPMKSERKSIPVEAGSPTVPNPFYEIDKAYEERRQRARARTERDRSFDNTSSRGSSPKAMKVEVPASPKPADQTQTSSDSKQETSLLSVIPDSVRPEARDLSPPPSQMLDFVDLTQSSPPVSPGGSDKDFAETHRLPRGSGWVQKNNTSTRRQTRQSSQSSRGVRMLEEMSISPPRRRRGRRSGT